MTDKDKLIHFAAQFQQLKRELWAFGESAKDLSFAASHQVGTACTLIDIAASRLTKIASNLGGPDV